MYFRLASPSVVLPTLLFATSLLMSGCGETSTEQTTTPDTPTTDLPTASIPPEDGESLEVAEPESARTPDRVAMGYLAEIKAIRQLPFPKKASMDEIRDIREKRNRQITEVAGKAISISHQDPKLKTQFAGAVKEMMEARLQLALQGKEDDISALYEDAEAIFQTYPESDAAAAANYALARLAHTNARRYGDQDPRWLLEFSTQARKFAAAFPKRVVEAAPMLSAAAFSCELHGQMDEAKACYRLLAETWPKTQQGTQAEATLRRLGLPGTVPEFGGTTIDGGFVNLTDYRGKPVVIHFWASDQKESVESVRLLAAIDKKYRERGLRMIGVNLDKNEIDVDRFMESNQLTWPQLFHPDSQQRRWNHPVVQYYGIRNIPTVWLVDKGGKFVKSTEKTENLESEIIQLLAR